MSQTWYKDVGSLYVEAFRNLVGIIEDNCQSVMIQSLWWASKITGSPLLREWALGSCDVLIRRLESEVQS